MDLDPAVLCGGSGQPTTPATPAINNTQANPYAVVTRISIWKGILRISLVGTRQVNKAEAEGSGSVGLFLEEKKCATNTRAPSDDRVDSDHEPEDAGSVQGRKRSRKPNPRVLGPEWS